jgi:hypothetical protein
MFAWLVTVWVPLSIIVNLVIDRLVCVPADSSEKWPAWVEAHPHWAGFVKFWRSTGVDGIKFAQGLWMGVSGRAKVDPAFKGLQ